MFEEEVVKSAFLEGLSGAFSGVGSQAHVNVTAARGADGAAGVLIEGEAAVGFPGDFAESGSGQSGGDEGEGSAGEDGFVGGDGAEFDDGGVDAAVGRALGFAEEYESRVASGVGLDLAGIAFEEVDHGVEA